MLGRVYGHNVVIACLPVGVCGSNATVTVTHSTVRFGLMVEIRGGILSLAKKIDVA